ncbi:MAG: alpha/beta fold hydrolase [Christensenellales bacterium]
MKKVIIYIHGKGGNAQEAEHYQSLFTNYDVIGFDYKSDTPWDARQEFLEYFDNLSKNYDSVSIIANSIGAFFCINALGDKKIEKAYFISPIVNMEQLILDMMQWANVTESDLQAQKRIATAFGETLSWEYLAWVRNHPIYWKIPAKILYGSKDQLQSIDAIESFAEQFGASVCVMENGEHWFHTKEQIDFLDDWIGR